MEKHTCSICKEEKPLSEYYLDKQGNKKSPRCKVCYNKMQYERDKVSPTKIRYIENINAIRKENSQKRIDILKLIRYNRTKINNLNKQLSIAKIKDSKRLIECDRINHYKSIADKYNTDITPLVKEWKYINGYEGLYKVSNYGEIYSCISNKMLKQTVNSHGYYKVNLHKNNTQTNMKPHRLVALMFIENELNKEEVNHIDSNTLNNMKTNLEWVTRVENADHRVCNNLKLIKRKLLLQKQIGSAVG